MFLDASVIVAILGNELGFEEIEKRMDDAQTGFAISPLVKFEAAMALARIKSRPGTKPSAERVHQAMATVDAFMADLDADEIPISSEIGRVAIVASATYGKTVGHSADLNLGDCFAYACAKTHAIPLLYKGNDFSKTDLA